MKLPERGKMTPDELQKATGEVEKQASKLNEELTRIIADGIMHRFEKYGEVKLSASDEYRIKTLKRAGISYGDIMEAIQSKTQGLDAEIKKVFKQTATNLGNVKKNSYVQKKATEPIKKNESGTTAKRIKKGPINANDLSQKQKEILNDVYGRTQNELSDFYGKTAYNGVKIYQQAVDEAIHKIQSGIGWQKAVRDAIKEVAKKGMYVEYPSGRMDTIETAILRAVRTGVNQANSKLVLERAAAEGQDLILVSSHFDARPTHQVWQGKIYSLSGNSKKYPEFYSSTGYGTIEGLCGINCRHTIMIYYPGVTRNPFKRYNKPANKKRYESSQKQRKLEREIRKTRRRKRVLEESKKNTGDPELKKQLNEEIEKEADKLRQQKDAYDAFVESNQLKKNAIRTYTPKYDAAQLKSAVTGYKEKVAYEKGKNYTNPKGVDISDRKRKNISTLPEQDALLANKNYNKGIEYQVNCQRCVPTYELRRRGYDVTAKPSILNDIDPINEKTWNHIFKNPEWLSCGSGNGLTKIKDLMKKFGDGARAEVYVQWENRKDAHVFVAEQRNGKTVFVDPQDGTRDASAYFDFVENGKTEICRIDNLELTDLIKECCEEYKYD